MSITYNEILKRMEEAFYDESGKYVKEYSDIALRFRAVASEIYAAYTNADYVLRQAFVQSAQGEFLDRHAALRDITRKTASKANGTLTFSLAQALEMDVEIPAETVCSVQSSPLIQFATDEKAVISAGELSVDAAATALAVGAEFNAPAGSITVMVNPPEYVASVTNNNAFQGGCDNETDEALRTRIIDSYSVASNAINKKSIEELVLTIDEVIDVNAVMDTDMKLLRMYMRTKSGEIDEDITEAVRELVAITKICTVAVLYYQAEAAEFSVFAALKAKDGADEQNLKNKVTQMIKELCSGQRIGRQLDLSRLAAAVNALEEVETAEIAATPSYEGTVTCGTGEYLVLTDVQVEIYA